MKLSVRLSPSAAGDIRYYGASEQAMITEAIRTHLCQDADQQTARRKRLRENLLAPWEARAGRYRIFDEILAQGVVKILAAGHKEHNDLFVRGRKVEM